MRFCYADPPYPGQAKRHYADHPDYAGEVDHAELIERLAGYDAWALSTSANALQSVLALCPPVRVLIWRKVPGSPMGDKIIYSYEPVLLCNGRRPTDYTRDVVEAMPQGFLMSFRARPTNHVTGAKPDAFYRWLFAVAGLSADDDFHDLFPGSGAASHAWAQWIAQRDLFEAAA